jgi:hypothetical protein
MRYVLYVIKNLYELNPIVSLPIWRMAYICGNTPFRAGGSGAYLPFRTFMQQLLKYGLWPCLCTLKYVS